ncbi:sensor histidine kinase [Labrys monachus]|uniref:histidine kinase n=1 Tax=Labrys monachus TaxID=217067 RepID=A0ABU0FCI7_9HYPH|nr:HAMP domain-containing sensor histidine kinase [Labrys monachus]MDQ0392305.1 signal transduction histidine kinase [Labrys monachus]
MPNFADIKDKSGLFGLSARLLVLTILFGMLAEVMIYLPSVATYRQNWLSNRISSAITAALVLEAAPNGMVSDSLAMQILDSVGAKMVALKMRDTKRLLASSEMPPQVATTTDLRNVSEMASIREAVATLIAPPGRFIRVIGNAPMNGQFVEIVIDEAPLKEAMYAASRRLLLISLSISAITGCLVYLTLSWLIVRPVRRLTFAMMHFGDNPEDGSRIVQTSRRNDEIGVAERELAAMQRQLLGMLQQKSRLAALGLAVSKINHDLRNLLAAAQLFSDRLTDSEDPLVQRFAPKLLQTLDRAIAFCQSTLSYGRAAEQLPSRRMIPVAPIVTDTRELLGLGGEDGIVWYEKIEPDLHIDADPDHLSRILLNLCRNALQALEAQARTEDGRGRIHVMCRRDSAAVIIEVADDGPGVPERARQRLFEAFAGSTRPGGSGLGLAIAAELVRAHGGMLTLLDQSPGATFRIRIPDRTGSPS